MTEQSSPGRTIRLGTRGSALARWQTDHVAGLLRAAYPQLRTEIEVISTRGDQILDKPLPLLGGKGLFTAELEAALREGRIDVAVHSLKDLPTEQPDGLTVGAIPARGAAGDVLISREGYTLDTLPHGAVVGTGSRRRAGQLKHQRPDLDIQGIRGNVDTRLDKAFDPDGPYDAIVLARAGLARLGREDAISEELALDVMLPAPGQGALGIQCRDEAASLDWLAPLMDEPTLLSVRAEREFLAGLGGGCSLPIAAYGQVTDARLVLRGRVTALDGTPQIEVEQAVTLSDDPATRLEQAVQLGRALGEAAHQQGADRLLAEIEQS